MPHTTVTDKTRHRSPPPVRPPPVAFLYEATRSFITRPRLWRGGRSAAPPPKELLTRPRLRRGGKSAAPPKELLTRPRLRRGGKSAAPPKELLTRPHPGGATLLSPHAQPGAAAAAARPLRRAKRVPPPPKEGYGFRTRAGSTRRQRHPSGCESTWRTVSLIPERNSPARNPHTSGLRWM